MNSERRPGNLRSDSTGVIYVEFLIAFLPVVTLFLGLLQLALIFTAQVVVRHAAFRAVRAAVVVLDDDPTTTRDSPSDAR